MTSRKGMDATEYLMLGALLAVMGAGVGIAVVVAGSKVVGIATGAVLCFPALVLLNIGLIAKGVEVGNRSK